MNKLICDATPDGVSVLPLVEDADSTLDCIKAVQEKALCIGPAPEPVKAHEYRPGARGKTWPKPRRGKK